MYDYEAQKDKLTGRPDVFITLLRGFELMGRLNTVQRAGGASSAVHTPGAQCLGRQVFEWSYAPYKVSDEDIAPFLPTVQSFLSPTTAHLIRSESEDEMYNSEELFGWDEPNLQFSAFKRSLDRDGYILRCYENQGKPTTLHLRVSDKFSRAWRSNMNEEELAPLELVDGRLQLKVGAYEAVSILLR